MICAFSFLQQYKLADPLLQRQVADLFHRQTSVMPVGRFAAEEVEVSAAFLQSGSVAEPRQFVVHRLLRDPGRHDRLQLCRMPITVFDCKGIPATRRECIEAAVVAGGKHATGAYEGWITTDPFKGGVRVLITGAHGSRAW